MIAQYIGAHREDKIQNAVHTTILFSMIGGLVIAAIGLLGAGGLLTIMGTPREILKDAIVYLRLSLIIHQIYTQQ